MNSSPCMLLICYCVRVGASLICACVSLPVSRCLCCHGGWQPPCGAVADYPGLPPPRWPGPLLPGLSCLERTDPVSGQHPLEATLPRLSWEQTSQLAQPATPGAPILERSTQAACHCYPYLDSKWTRAPVFSLSPLFTSSERSQSLARGPRMRIGDPSQCPCGCRSIRPCGPAPRGLWGAGWNCDEGASGAVGPGATGWGGSAGMSGAAVSDCEAV